VDHADAEAYGIRRRFYLNGPALDFDLALVGAVESEEDRHQGGLAGAIFADNAMNGPLGDFQGYVLVGVNSAKAFVDTDEFNGWGHGYFNETLSREGRGSIVTKLTDYSTGHLLSDM
jgi:hypothetical protein